MGIKKPASGAGAWVSGAKLNSGVSASLDTRIVLPANGTWFSSFNLDFFFAQHKQSVKNYFRNRLRASYRGIYVENPRSSFF